MSAITTFNIKAAFNKNALCRRLNIGAAFLLCCAALLLPIPSQAQGTQSGSTQAITPKFESILNASADAWRAYREGTGPCPIGDCSTLNQTSSTPTVIDPTRPSGVILTGEVDRSITIPIVPAGSSSGGTNNNGIITIRPAGSTSTSSSTNANSNGIVVIGGNQGSTTTNTTSNSSNTSSGSSTSTDRAIDPITGTVTCIGGGTLDTATGQCTTSTTSATSAENCDESKGGMGEAIKSAMQVHGEFAAVQPHIDEIFERSANCFRGATTIYDMSPSIPSIWDIIDAAIQAVKDYAVQQICNLAYRLTSQIRAAIGEVLTTIQELGKVGDISVINLTSSLFTGSSAQNVINSISFAGSAKDMTDQTRPININGLGLSDRCIQERQTCEQITAAEEAELQEIQRTIGTVNMDLQKKYSTLTSCRARAQTSNPSLSDAAIDAGVCKSQANDYNAKKAEYDTMRAREAELQSKKDGSACITDTVWGACPTNTSTKDTAAGGDDSNSTTTTVNCTAGEIQAGQCNLAAKSKGVAIMPTPQTATQTTTTTKKQQTQSSASTQKKQAASQSWLKSLGGLLGGSQ